MEAVRSGYDFSEQLALSRVRDAELDKHFASDWKISRELPRHFERLGIDRVWVHRKSGRRWTVEYKHDTIAHRTRNAFVETVSVEGDNGGEKKLGWAYTSCAQVLVYYVVGGEYALVLRMSDIENRLPCWEAQYNTRTTTTLDKRTGESYRTSGLLVPILVFRGAASKVVPVYSGDEPTADSQYRIPTLRGSGVLR